jgi:secreted trypsin-like serine protease
LVASVWLAGAACSGPVDEPVEVARRSEAIFNGHRATAAEQWGTVGLDVYIGQNGGWTCTGTLIGSRLVVTAAHCVLEDGSGPITELYVVAGAPDLYAPSPEQIYEVSRYVAHPEAFPEDGEPTDLTGLGRANDIAIVETVNPVDAEVIPIVPLDEIDAVLVDGAGLTVAGFGVTNLTELENGSTNAFHNVGSLSYVRRSEHEFLAGNAEESDTCVGDSGGPAYLVSGGKATLVGATSRGRIDVSVDMKCGAGGIYTLVPAYVDWIEQNATVPIGGQLEPGDDDGPDGADDDSNDDDTADEAEEDPPITVRKAKRDGCSVHPGPALPMPWSPLLVGVALLARRRLKR